MYHSDFLNKEELNLLKLSVLENYDPKALKNTISLKGAESIIAKFRDFFIQSLHANVHHLRSYIFLASESTMKSRIDAPDQGWHTDGTCQVVDGDCYNVWVPLYNDAAHTGIEIISEKENPEVYQRLGDPTSPITVYTREKAPWVFSLIEDERAKSADLLVIKPHLGTILPLFKEELYIDCYNQAQPGDIAVFKQSELHRGFHENGIRIQLSLKFRTEDAKLNTKSSNQLYKLYRSVSREADSYDQFFQFLSLIDQPSTLTKHGMLEKDLIKSLLRNQLLKVEFA